MANVKSSNLDLSDLDDRAIQKILREIDTSELVVALFDANEDVKGRIYKNMSKRACELLIDDMEARSDITSSEPSVKKINGIIKKLVDAGEIIRGKPTPAGKKVPSLEIDTSSAAATIESFRAIAEKARKHGLLSLEDDVKSIRNEFFRKGLQFVIDGTDPDIIKSILSTELDTIRQNEELEIKEAVLRMKKELAVEIAKKKQIIEGVLSIQSGDNPRIIVEKMRAYGA